MIASDDIMLSSIVLLYLLWKIRSAVFSISVFLSLCECVFICSLYVMNELSSNYVRRFQCFFIELAFNGNMVVFMLISVLCFPTESMPSTGRVILRPVDGERNLKCGKPGFRCVPHKTWKIAVRIEIDGLIAIG